MTYYLASTYGLTGSAWPWLLLNLGFVVLYPPIIFRKLGVKPSKLWYLEAIVIPIMISVCSLWFFKLIYDVLSVGNIFLIFLSLGVSYVLVALRLFVFRFDIQRVQWRIAL
ncbi:hypothetical protein DYL59_02650 [Pseudomonas kairouanensis]|uniref:Uncharacterized protein n=1 Tax=Pseudomonas kairouanensis TaxID=2293832 RepID=A0A4Z0AZ45_9PSED|nr:hypothetical protein DYL59_02650 [Pseudomonas kairouanensis]